MDIDEATDPRSRRRRVATEKGTIYNAERRRAACLAIQTKLTKQINKIDSAAKTYDNSHEVQHELETLVSLHSDLDEAYKNWQKELSDEQEKVEALKWYEEQRARVIEFQQTITQWLTEAKRNLEEQLDKQYFKPPSTSSSKSSHSKSSSASSKLKERLKVAELRAKVATLERKQRLENETEKLKLEEELAMAEAREQIYSRLDDEQTADNMNPYYHENVNSKATPVTSISHNVTERTVNMSAPVMSTNVDIIGTTAVTPNLNPCMTKFSPILHAYSPPPSLSSVSSNLRPFNMSPIHAATNLTAFGSSWNDRVHTNEKSFIPALHEMPPVSYDVPKFTQPMTRRNVAHMTGQTLDEDRFGSLIDRQCNLTELLMEQNEQSLLPRLILPRFKGDPIEFTTFIQGFDIQFGKKLRSDADRLRYLDQYLDGEAKELIKGCFYMHHDVGYVEARKLLEDKYGDPYRISNAFIKKAAEWPILKPGDSIGLEHFSIFLTQCSSAMNSLSYLSILDHPHNLQTLARKLPFNLQDRWRREAVKTRSGTVATPTFASFAAFIKTEAKVATDPIFSERSLKSSRFRLRTQTQTWKLQNQK
jgi:hypothetical protein